MDRMNIEHWRIIIDEDLKDARRCLTVTSGFAVRFLRDRIAENEAILGRLASMEGATGLSTASPPGR